MDDGGAVALLGEAATIATSVGGAALVILGIAMGFRMARRAFS